uniref:Integrin, alpha 8 n=1 Tax=Eptatretus burgeri TaxID=7764 RepID=A0A8C4NJA4_EPTBU
MYMAQGEDGRLQERGQVYLYMQQTPKQLVRSQVLLGSDIYGRFGSAIAALGDVDQDGYNDVAIGMPFGGDNMGLVFIYNGLETGLKTDPSQTLRGQWANRAPPQGFGFALRGGTDLDSNGYPDLLVGAFGVDKAVLYRARPVVSVNSQLNISPLALNPENKTCSLPGSSLLLSCFVVQYCLEISGKGLPASVALRVDIQLDQLKERGAIKRTLFQQQNSTRFFTHVQLSQAKQTICRSLGAVLKDEREFRDKLSPVVIGFNYSLDMTHKPENKSVPPILNHYISKSLTQQAHILLDCGKDNICVPDLHLSGSLDRSKVFIGEEHPLILSLYCSNAGEGAYEAELVVELPDELEYDGTYNSDTHHLALACTYKLQNSTKMVICDLGNPMKAGTSVLLKLRFSFTQLTNLTTSLAFHGKLRSSNQVPSKRQTLTLSAEVAVSAHLIIRGPFRPAEPAVHVSEWPAVHNPNAEFDVGPQLQQVIQLYNDGPSSVQSAWLRIEIPLQFEQERLLYPIYLEVEGPLNCSSNMPLNPLQLSISRGQNQSWHTSKPPDRVRRENSRRSNIQPIADCEHGGCLEISCQVGHLPKRNSTVLYINSRLWASFFHKAKNSAVMLQTRISFQATEMLFPILPQELSHGSIIVNATIVRIIRDYKRPVPYHVIFLAVLAGLLLLSLLVYALWKCGFFKRDRFLHNEFPAEKAFLKPRQNGTQA